MSSTANGPTQNPSRWIPVERNYVKEKQQGVLKSSEAKEHPLGENYVGTALNSSQKKESFASPKVNKNAPAKDPLNANFNDPLSAAAFDPLSSSVEIPYKSTPTLPQTTARASVILSNANTAAALRKEEMVAAGHEDTFVPWNSKKLGILQEYTTDEFLGIQASFMEGVGTAGTVKPGVDKTQQRLAQLEEQDSTKETLQLTQKDYEKHIEKLHEELIKAWNGEERVKSLKIAIQCAKLLNDTTVVKFYPSKFVLITEILDSFGRLVYERIASRTTENGATIKSYSPEKISEQAKETCRNWFYKIASVREMIPRLYVEMAIIKSYNFIQHSGFSTVINRLCKMIRGIGDPLVATYARAYLARKAHEVEPTYKDYLLQSFYDDMFNQNVIKQPKFEESLTKLHVNMKEYLHLFSPSVEWILSCIGHFASVEVLTEVLNKYKETSNVYVLKHIISSFPPELISTYAKDFVGLIKEAPDMIPKYQLYAALGANLVLASPPKEHVLAILNEVWKVCTKLEDIKEYITVADIYIEYPVKHATSREVNILLGDILRHVKEGLAYEKYQSQLQSILSKVLNTYNDFTVIFGMDNFLPMLDLFTGEALLEVNKSILLAFSKFQDTTSDPIIINTMFTVGKNVHDSINALSFLDEVRQISRLIAAFISKIDFGIDLEKHLNFFVECRRAFSNLDHVKYQLVLGACSLAMKALRIVKGKHTKKTSSFIRACISYCFITIPSMEEVFPRLQLYLLSSEVALLNQAISQADSLLKAAIKLVQEVPNRLEIDSQIKSTEEPLVSYLNNFVSLLVVVPGHPEQGPFYLVKGLLKVVSEYTWENVSAKVRVYISMLSLFSAYQQQKFPYKINGVDSNDVLYGADSDYSSELQALINKVLEDILEELSKLKDSTDDGASRVQSKLALDLLNALISFSELNAKSATLAVNLYTLAKKGTEPAYLNNCVRYLKSKDVPLAKELVKKLATM